MIDKIFDLPVIIQGALGSFLFWLAYVVSQRAINSASNLIGNYSKSINKENALFEMSHLLQDVIPVDSAVGNKMHLLSIQAALYKFIKGVIFLTFGLISSEFIGLVSVIGYVIAVYYFFRALKAGYIQMYSSGITKEEKKRRIDELAAILELEHNETSNLTS